MIGRGRYAGRIHREVSLSAGAGRLVSSYSPPSSLAPTEEREAVSNSHKSSASDPEAKDGDTSNSETEFRSWVWECS